MRLFPVLGICVGLLFCRSAEAHFIWASVVNKHLQLELADAPGDAPEPFSVVPVAAMKRFRVGPFTAEKDGLHLDGDLSSRVGGVSLLYGVFQGWLVHWSAKGAASIADAGSTLGLPLEITLRSSGNGLVARVVKNGRAANGATLYVYSGPAKPATFTVGAGGTVALPAFSAGVLRLAAVVMEKSPGTYKGNHYQQKGEFGTLTVGAS